LETVDTVGGRNLVDFVATDAFPMDIHRGLPNARCSGTGSRLS
jgi:hypothetical protein